MKAVTKHSQSPYKTFVKTFTEHSQSIHKHSQSISKAFAVALRSRDLSGFDVREARERKQKKQQKFNGGSQAPMSTMIISKIAFWELENEQNIYTAILAIDILAKVN